MTKRYSIAQQRAMRILVDLIGVKEQTFRRWVRSGNLADRVEEYFARLARKEARQVKP